MSDCPIVWCSNAAYTLHLRLSLSKWPLWMQHVRLHKACSYQTDSCPNSTYCIFSFIYTVNQTWCKAGHLQSRPFTNPHKQSTHSTMEMLCAVSGLSGRFYSAFHFAGQPAGGRSESCRLSQMGGKKTEPQHKCLPNRWGHSLLPL